MFIEIVGLDNKVQHQLFNTLTKPIGYFIKLTVHLKQSTKNTPDLQVLMSTEDSLEI
jgi:hypothetical protein